MKRQTRPFAVEIKRSKSPVPDDQERTVPALPKDPDAVRPEQKSEIADGGLAQALEMAAQVFGAPRPAPAQPTEHRQPATDEPITGSSPEHTTPPAVRLLPDLLALAREERAATDRSTRRTRATRQPAGKPKGDAPVPRTRKAGRKAFGLPDANSMAGGNDVGEGVDSEAASLQTGRTHETPARAQVSKTERLTIAATPSVGARPSGRARSALRMWNGSSRSELPRGERWKERRLPRVCWKRSKSRQS